MEVGLAVGVELGAGLGILPGATLGKALEVPLGPVPLGEELGNVLGLALGEALGLALEEVPGVVLGSALGLELGNTLGDLVGPELGGGLGTQEGPEKRRTGQKRVRELLHQTEMHSGPKSSPYEGLPENGRLGNQPKGTDPNRGRHNGSRELDASHRRTHRHL